MNKNYGNVLSVLSKLFDSMGQNHLISLLKLRKLWSSEVNSFLAKNSFPRNISVIQKFTLNLDNINKFNKSKLSLDFFQALKKINKLSFNHLEQFHSHLTKELNRLLNQEEKEWLKNNVRLKSIKTILHVTVYDGSVSQAIGFEKEAYLRIFNRLLPEIKLDEIHCQVGDIRRTQFDQIQLSTLAKDWNLITPKEIHKKCMPAFFHRVSRKYVVLVLFVSNKENLDLLTLNKREDFLLYHLKKKFIEFQHDLRKIKFVLKTGIDLEKVRSHSIILGNFSDGNSNSTEDIMNSLETKILENKLSAMA